MIFLHLCLSVLAVLLFLHRCFKIFIFSNNSLFIVENFIWPKGQYGLIGKSLLDVDWNDELCLLGQCEQYTRFLSILRSLIRRLVPCSNRASITRVPWARASVVSII